MPHSQQNAPPDELVARGVYEHPYRGPSGERYLVAVDHRGCRVFEATVFPNVKNVGAVTVALRNLLEKVDPQHLSLMQ